MTTQIDNCTRIERRIITRLIRDALKSGFGISVNDGEETTLKNSRSPGKITAAMFTTDEDLLLLHRAGENRHFAWIQLIYGNGCDVISDYTTNIEYIMKPVSQYAETFQ